MYIFTCNLTKYIYIYIFKNSYTYFPPNLVQKACLQALASSCKHYHSKSRIQGLRFKIQKELLESKRQDSRFKIFSGSPWIQGLAYKIEDSRFQWLFLNPGAWAQDSRFKIQKELLESKEVDSRFRIFSGFSWIQGLGYKTQDSRFKIRKELLESRPYTRLCENKRSFCILNLESRPLDSRKAPENLESWIRPPGFKKFFFGSWIFNLESRPLDLRKASENTESWIHLLRFQKFFLDLESSILYPSPWIQGEPLKILNLESSPLDSRSSFWILNLESCAQAPGFKKSPWKSWILNPPAGFKKFFLDLEFWILNLVSKPWIQGKTLKILNLESSLLDSKGSFWILNLKPWIRDLEW